MKLTKKLIYSACIISLLSVSPAFAADTSKTASLWTGTGYGNDIIINGKHTYCLDASGRETYCLTCDNTVYIPLRTAAEWLGKDLVKSPDGKTFTLSGSKTPVYHGRTQDIYADMTDDARRAKLAEPVPVTVLEGARLIADGETVTLPGGGEMLAWYGEPYLPVRAAAQLMGMDAHYSRSFRTSADGVTSESGAAVFLRTPLTEEQAQACTAYADTLRGAADGLLTICRSTPETAGAAETAVGQYLSYVHILLDTPKPDGSLLDTLYPELQAAAGNAVKAGEQVRQMLQRGDGLEKIQYAFNLDWTAESYDRGTETVNGLKTVGTRAVLAADDLWAVVYKELR